LYERNTY